MPAFFYCDVPSLPTVLSFPLFPVSSYHQRNSHKIQLHFRDKNITEIKFYREVIALAAMLEYQYYSPSNLLMVKMIASVGECLSP